MFSSQEKHTEKHRETCGKHQEQKCETRFPTFSVCFPMFFHLFFQSLKGADREAAIVVVREVHRVIVEHKNPELKGRELERMIHFFCDHLALPQPVVAKLCQAVLFALQLHPARL